MKYYLLYWKLLQKILITCYIIIMLFNIYNYINDCNLYSHYSFELFINDNNSVSSSNTNNIDDTLQETLGIEYFWIRSNSRLDSDQFHAIWITDYNFRSEAYEEFRKMINHIIELHGNNKPKAMRDIIMSISENKQGFAYFNGNAIRY